MERMGPYTLACYLIGFIETQEEFNLVLDGFDHSVICSKVYLPQEVYKMMEATGFPSKCQPFIFRGGQGSFEIHGKICRQGTIAFTQSRLAFTAAAVSAIQFKDNDGSNQKE